MRGEQSVRSMADGLVESDRPTTKAAGYLLFWVLEDFEIEDLQAALAFLGPDAEVESP